MQINVREYQRGNHQRTIHRNLQQGTQDKEKQNTICVGHHYTQTNTNNVYKTCVLQTTGGKDEPNFVFMWKS